MLVIFDWDGTLCQSLDRIVLSVQKSAADLGLPALENERVRGIVGLGLQEAMDELFPGVSDELRLRIRERYSHHFVSLDQVAPSPLYEDAMDTLEALRARGYQLAVATGKSRIGLDRVLANLNMIDYFDCTRCADETRSKPHPQMLQEILQEMGRPAEESLMVGDTEFDLEMANAAGIRGVAVTYGAHPLPRLQACRPWRTLDSLAALTDEI
jgi:phosphoglycolate phosphatase